MLLKNLIKNIPYNKKGIKISGISTNSKEVKKNFIFFAIKGNTLNGEKFIKDAISRGASVVICSKNCQIRAKNILILKRKNLRYLLSQIASKYYKLKPKNIIAVTGTNGKTSVADLFYQILNNCRIPVASIGTLGIKYKNKIIKTYLTTPDTITIHKYLYYLKKKKIDNVIIECSSHGLVQKRLHHINFKGAIFTNFSQDHLDYHKTMKTYLDAKLILFKKILKKNSSIISDKEIKPFFILRKIANRKKFKIIEITNEVKKIENHNLDYTSDFKIKNLAMAINATKLCGLKDEKIYSFIRKLKDVNGRFELVKKFANNIRVFVDYAHTPDALLKTITSLKNTYGNNISVVFGCGGERDRKKRPLMAKIADKNCRKIYITDDNPRNENPKKIRKELLRSISIDDVYDIGNRSLAIKKAIENAEPQEVLLIAGKGHEEQQIYKNKILNISDKKIIKQIKSTPKVKNRKKINYTQNQLILNKIINKQISANFIGLSIDTRSLKKDNLFLAIKGKKFDGNNFINEALKKGAGLAITNANIKKKK